MCKCTRKHMSANFFVRNKIKEEKTLLDDMENR